MLIENGRESSSSSGKHESKYEYHSAGKEIGVVDTSMQSYSRGIGGGRLGSQLKMGHVKKDAAGHVMNTDESSIIHDKDDIITNG